MTSNHALPPQLRPLLDAVCDGVVSRSELQELESLALADVSARKQLLRYLELDAVLRWEFGAGMETRLPAAIAPPTTAGHFSPSTLKASTNKVPDAQPNTKPIWTKIPAITFNRSVMASIAAVALVFYGSFLAISWNLWMVREPQVTVVSSTTDTIAATILSEKNTIWSHTGLPGTTSRLSMGQKLSLTSGTVELELAQGARLVVEGPADWSVDSRNSVSLRAGKLMAHVPGQAIGFTVETPTAKIVDLGTEFGVEVNATGRTDVQVLKGAVDVSYPVQNNGSKSRQSLRMTAGNAKRFGARPGSAEVTVSEIAPWLDTTTGANKQIDDRKNLPPETKYAAAVLADHPLGYWRFSDTDGHRAVDASGHDHHGEYVGFVSTNNPGICANTSDRSIRFLGKNYGGYVQIKDFEIPASFTVELWARSVTTTWNTYGWIFNCSSANGLSITPSEERGWSVYIQNRRDDCRPIGRRHDLLSITDRFHQYAVSYDATLDQGRMYCDGKLISETDHVFGDAPPHEAARKTFYLGRLDPRTPNEIWGEGSVDELAIYDGALTSEAMKQHYEAADSPIVNRSNP